MQQWNLVPFLKQVRCDAPYLLSSTYVVQRAYGQPCGLYMDSQKQKRKYISGIAAMTAGQILVIIIIIIIFYTLG